MKISKEELNTVIKIGTKRNSQLATELLDNQTKIDNAVEVLRDAQGEWAGVDEIYAPAWCGPLKEAIKVLEEE